MVTGVGGGVRIFQVWVGVTVISLSWIQVFQLRNKFLEFSLLGRGGEYFWYHANGINRISGCRNIGLVIGREHVLMVLLLLLRWTVGICGEEDVLGGCMGGFCETIHPLGCTGESSGGAGEVENVGRISSRHPQGGRSVHRNQNIAL